MGRGTAGWQQTGFRANRALLNRFRSKLALEGNDMGEVLEAFIDSYVAGSYRKRTTVAVLDSSVLDVVAQDPLLDTVHYIMLKGGDAEKEFLRDTSFALAKLVRAKIEPPVDTEPPPNKKGPQATSPRP